MLASPGGPYFASPASYGHLPFGGGATLSPAAHPSPGGYFAPPPPHFQGQYGGGVGPGAPPMALQHSLAGSEAPSMLRSSSTSSTASTSTIPATPSNFGSAFFPNSHSHHQHPPPQVFTPPPRTKLHASTPSFHPGGPVNPFAPPPPSGRGHHPGRTQSISVRPQPGGLKSPTLTRAASVSPALSSAGLPPAPRDEPKKKKIVVRFPRERDEEDEFVEGKEGRKQSTMRRAPLRAEESERREQKMQHDVQNVVALEDDELVGRKEHFDEVKVKGLPETLEVFLPGKEAWEDAFDAFVQETTNKFGYFDGRKPSFLPSSRAQSFLRLDSTPSSPLSASGFSTPNPRAPGKHGRTASLFSATPSSLPPRLASVLDNLRAARPGTGGGSGHGSSLSLSFAGGLAALRGSTLSSPGSLSPGGGRLTPLAKSFTMPGWGSPSTEKTPLPGSPLQENPLPLDAADAALAPAVLEKKEQWKPSLQELGRGFGVGIEEEDEEGAEGALVMDQEVAMASSAVLEVETAHASAAAAEAEQPQSALPSQPTTVELATGDGVGEAKGQERKEEQEAQKARAGRGSEPPSRRASTMSTKTDHTGVASQSDGFVSSAAEDGEKSRPSSPLEQTPEPDVKEDFTRCSGETAPSLSIELSRALSDLGSLSGEAPRSPSTALPALPTLPALPAIEIHVEHEQDGGYNASDDSDWADAELSQSEYSDPSEEEDARARAVFRARSSRALRQEALDHQQQQQQLLKQNEDLDLPSSDNVFGPESPFAPGRASSLAVDPASDVLFQAPSDVDATDAEMGGHRVAQNFEFPPRSPGKSPTKPRETPHPEAVKLPSSPESLSNAVQPGLPSIGSFGARRSSLNVAAPEFTFGGASLNRRFNTTSSLGGDDFAFGSFGQPGSLAASPSLPLETPPASGGSSASFNPTAAEVRPPALDATCGLGEQGTSSLTSATAWGGDMGEPGSIAASSPCLPPAPQDETPTLLNALANEFRPLSVGGAAVQSRAFSFTAPPGAPTFVMPAPAESVEQPRRVSSGRGPLPPVPLVGVAPHSAAVKRQKVNGAGDLTWLPGSIAGATSDSPQRAVSAPQLVHPQPRRPLPLPPLEQLHHLQHRRLNVLDVDQEETEMREAAGSEAGNASLMSMDDPLPEQYAPSHPVVGRRATGAGGSGTRPFSLRSAASFTSDGRVLGFQGVAETPAMSTATKRRSPLPPLPSLETPGSSLDAGRGEKERRAQVSPARMGDPRARQESVDMALPTAARPRSRAVPIPRKKEAEVRDIFGDGETMSLTPSAGDSVVEFSGDEEEGAEEDDLPLRILENIISTQFNGLKAEMSSLRAQPDHDALVDALATRVELLLATSNLRAAEPSDFPSLLAGAHERIERAVLDALERFQPAAASFTLAPPPARLEPQLSLSAPVTPIRPVTPFDGGPAAAYGSFLDDLRATVQPLAKNHIDHDLLTSKLAALIQPQLADMLSRLASSSHETAAAVASKLEGSLAAAASATAIEKAGLASQIAQHLEPCLAPIASLDNLADRITQSLTQQLGEKLATTSLRAAEEGQALAIDVEALVQRISEELKGNKPAGESLESARSALDALAEAQDKLISSNLAIKEAQVGLKSSFGQLGLDVTSRLESAYSSLEALFEARIATSNSSGAGGADPSRLAELEIQLTKARNDHGKARSEKSVLSDRLEAEKARHVAEVEDFRRQLAKHTDTIKAGEVERAVAVAQAERVQQEMAALRARCVELEERRNSARKSLEEEEHRRQEREHHSRQQKDEIARLQHELQQAKATSSALEREQRTTQRRLDTALAEKEQSVREKQEAKEALAAAKGMVESLEKRLNAQDERLANLQRVKLVQQQTLAVANQRNSELRKDANKLQATLADLTAARSKVNELEGAAMEWENREKALAEDNERYRQQFSSLEQGLTAMKATVSRELDDASTRVTALTEERDRLADENARLANENARLLSRPNHGDNLSAHFHDSPDPSHYYTSPLPASAPSTPPSFAPASANGLPKPAILEPQYTGDSAASDETVAHTSVSPAPSVSGSVAAFSYVQDADGWFSAA
ncbi:hypothetical protein JCM10213v2_006732 [Rhodosporidiobolus nylandii]